MRFASVLAGLLILGLGDLGAAGRSVLFSAKPAPAQRCVAAR